MARGRCLLLLAAGCGFQASDEGAATIDASPIDARRIDSSVDDSTSIDGASDGPIMVDASIDASPPSVSTTNHQSVADTFLSTVMPTTNFNDQTSALSDGDGRVVVIRFDLTAIPVGAMVTAAELHIWSDSDPGQTCTFYPLLQSWTESTATWNQRSTGTAWAAAGAAPPSRSTTAAGTVLPTSTNTGYTVTIDPAVVAGWVATPATNNGFAIVSVNSDGARFSTREHPSSAVRPYLRVTHAP
jgi:hypothetical protein